VRGSRPEVRLAVRQARSRPIIEDLRRWLDRTLQNLSAKSDMAVAIRYALARRAALIRYLDDSTIEIDGPLPSMRFSAQPISTASTRNATCDTSSPVSPTTPSTA
jgi:hypothetical protein